MENKIVSQVFNEYVEYSIRTTTCQVTEGLRRDDTGKGPMTKIDDPYYDMSGL